MSAPAAQNAIDVNPSLTIQPHVSPQEMRRNRTGRSRQSQGRVGGVTPAGLSCCKRNQHLDMLSIGHRRTLHVDLGG